MAGISFSHLRVSASEGFLCSWAKDVAFHDVQVDTGKGPALTARDVDGLEFDGFRTARPHPEAPVIDLNQVRDVFLRACWAARGAGAFVKIGGPSSWRRRSPGKWWSTSRAPSSGHRVNWLEEGKAMEVRVASDDSSDAMLSHQHRGVCAMHQVSTEVGNLSQQLGHYRGMPFSGSSVGVRMPRAGAASTGAWNEYGA